MRKRRWLRRLIVVLVVLLLLPVLAWVFRWTLLEGTIRRAISTALEDQGLRITAGEMRGSLVSDFEVEKVRVEPLTGDHVLRRASIDRVRVTLSLADLVRGADDWLGGIHVEGLRVLADAGGTVPAAPSSGASGEGPGIVPDFVRVRDAEVTLLSGENVASVAGALLDVDRIGDGEWRGILVAADARATVDGREYVHPENQLSFTVRDRTVVVRRAGSEDFLEVSLEGDEVDGRLDLRFLGGRLSGTVSTDNELITAQLGLESIEPGPVLAFLPDLNAACDRVDGEVTANYDMARKAISGEYELNLDGPRTEGHSAGSVSVAGRLAAQVLTARGSTKEPASEFEASIHLDQPGWVRGVLIVEDFDLEPLGLVARGRQILGRVTGAVRVQGTVDSPVAMVDLDVVNPGFGADRADRLSVRGSATLEDAFLDDLLLVRGEDELSARGVVVLDDQITFSGTATASITSLAAFREELIPDLPDDLAGNVVISVSACGTLDRPHAEIVVSGESLTVEGVFADSLEATFEMPEFGNIRARELAVAAPWIEIRGENILVTLPEGLENGESITVDGAVDIHRLPFSKFAEFVEIPAWTSCELAGKLTARGTIRDLSADVRLTAEDLRCRIPGRGLIDTGRVEILGTYEDHRARLDRLTMSGEGWSLEAKGKVDSDPLRATAPEYHSAALTGTVEIRNAPLGVTGPLPGIAVANGTTNATLELLGTLNDPRVAGQLTLAAKKIVAEDQDVPPLEDLSFRADFAGFGPAGGRVVLSEASVRASDSTIRISQLSAEVLHEPFGLKDLELDATVEGLDVDRLAGRLGRTEFTDGVVDLEIKVTKGPVANVVARGRDITLRRQGLLRAPPEFEPFEFEATWKDGWLTIADANLRSSDRRLQLDASIPLVLALDPLTAELDEDRPLKMHLKATGLTISDLYFEPRDLRLSGRLGVELSADGLPGAMELGGRIEWKSGFLRFPGAPALDDVEGIFRLDKDRIVIERLKARSGRGEVQAKGYLALGRNVGDDLVVKDVDLAVDADRALLVRDQSMLLRANLKTRITGGGLDPFLVSGSVDVVSLRYTKDVDILTGGPALAALPLTDDPLVGSSRLDLTVVAPHGSIKVRNNVVDADLSGRLQVGGTIAIPRPKGQIISDRGRIWLPVVTMKVETASLTFRPEDPFRPRIRAHLSATASRVSADARVRGTPDALEITATSVPPMPSEDVVTLLATGEMPQNLKGSSAASVAATVLYRQLVAGFSRDEGEDSTLVDLASRVEEVSINTGASGPEWRATIRLWEDWLYLRADQVEAFDYGLDLLVRLSFR